MIISVIIITLNEAENLENVINKVKNAASHLNENSAAIEIIVSDGGSTDGTISIAKTKADMIIRSPRGRYKQLNEGAKVARGDIFLFLHADTLLPEDGFLRIIKTLKNHRVIGGGFKKCWNWRAGLKITSFIKSMSSLWQDLGNWLVRLFKTFPGDNAIFVRKNYFDRLNGFSSLWICEDFDFSRRLKQFGRKSIAYINSPVTTSTRRFEEYGFFKLLILWTLIYFFWRIGMPTEKLRNRFQNYSIIPSRTKALALRF